MTNLIAAASFFFLVTKTVEVPALGRAESLMTQEGDSTQSELKVIEGQILAVDPNARNFIVMDGKTSLTFSWDERTRMTVARHTVKPSALLPEAPRRNHKKNSQTTTSFVKSIMRHLQRF